MRVLLRLADVPGHVDRRVGRSELIVGLHAGRAERHAGRLQAQAVHPGTAAGREQEGVVGEFRAVAQQRRERTPIPASFDRGVVFTYQYDPRTHVLVLAGLLPGQEVEDPLSFKSMAGYRDWSRGNCEANWVTPETAYNWPLDGDGWVVHKEAHEAGSADIEGDYLFIAHFGGVEVGGERVHRVSDGGARRSCCSTTPCRSPSTPTANGRSRRIGGRAGSTSYSSTSTPTVASWYTVAGPRRPARPVEFPCAHATSRSRLKSDRGDDAPHPHIADVRDPVRNAAAASADQTDARRIEAGSHSEPGRSRVSRRARCGS